MACRRVFGRERGCVERELGLLVVRLRDSRDSRVEGRVSGRKWNSRRHVIWR